MKYLSLGDLPLPQNSWSFTTCSLRNELSFWPERWGMETLTVPDECSIFLLRNDRSALLIQCFLNPANISQDISIYFQTEVTISLPVKNPESPSFIIFSAVVVDCHRSPNQFLTLGCFFFSNPLCNVLI